MRRRRKQEQKNINRAGDRMDRAARRRNEKRIIMCSGFAVCYVCGRYHGNFIKKKVP